MPKDEKKNFTGETTTKFVKEELVSKYGVPKAFLSDQVRNFVSNQFEKFRKNSGIKKVRTTSYHPQSNGSTEKTIRTIKKMLSCYENQDHDNWDEILAEVVFAYINSEHSSTGFARINEVPSESNQAPKVTNNCDVEGCTHKTDSLNDVALHKDKSHKIAKDAQ